MTLDDYNAFCGGLTHASHVVQWGGAPVWKVGRPDGGHSQIKVFAIAGWSNGAEPGFTFKVSPMSFDLLREMPGLRPAPYLASRGMKWIQRVTDESMDDEGLKAYLAESHRLVAAGLSARVRRELGFG